MKTALFLLRRRACFPSPPARLSRGTFKSLPKILHPSVCIPSSYDSRLQSDREASAAAAATKPSSSSSNRPDLWSEPTAFGERAHFRASASPAVLSVTGVQRFDAGTFMCRVDFRQSPTVYHTVELDVIGERGESEYRIV